LIVDTSALVAILRQEPGARQFADAMQAAPHLSVSVATLFETSVVIDAARDPVISRELDDLVRRAGVELHAVTAQQGRIAREAYRDFGRGSGHPAKLNFGDCFAYALAKELSEPLLFKGNDFIHTDIEPAG
jgi:ribonuclease VapC